MAVVPEARTCALGRGAGTARELQLPLHSTSIKYLLHVNIFIYYMLTYHTPNTLCEAGTALTGSSTEAK